MKTCPKCRQKSDAEQCPSCDLVFAEYEQKKMRKTGEVYQLISSGKLQEAKELAEQLSSEFPDSRTDFILLISNINRDLNIAKKYLQAQELFNQGEYEQTALLLRNIKAFDPGLEEKVIGLRRKAKQQGEHTEHVKKAIVLFENKRYGEARTAFLKLQKHHHNDENISNYIGKLDKIRGELINAVIESLGENNFQFAQEKFNKMLAIFPDAEEEYSAIAKVLKQRKEINSKILEAAETARKKGRLLEAKVMYTFLYWQNHELHPQLRPYIREIGSEALVSLADCAQYNRIDFNDTGLQVKDDGFLQRVVTEQQLTNNQYVGERYTPIAPVYICTEPLTDPLYELVNIDGLEIADFV
ncbi:Tetratricopeptide repeat-containing protein [Candidatus Electrothrix laxa]